MFWKLPKQTCRLHRKDHIESERIPSPIESPSSSPSMSATQETAGTSGLSPLPNLIFCCQDVSEGEQATGNCCWDLSQLDKAVLRWLNPSERNYISKVDNDQSQPLSYASHPYLIQIDQYCERNNGLRNLISRFFLSADITDVYGFINIGAEKVLLARKAGLYEKKQGEMLFTCEKDCRLFVTSIHRWKTPGI